MNVLLLLTLIDVYERETAPLNAEVATLQRAFEALGVEFDSIAGTLRGVAKQE